MKTRILAILILIMVCECKPTTEIVTGDLYFSFFRISSYYNQPDSVIDHIEKYFDTLNDATADTEQKKFHAWHKLLKEEKLLHHPFVDLFTEQNAVATLYLEPKDYDQLKKYKRKDLMAEGKKIKIQAEARKIAEGLFYCVSLKKVEKVDGETRIKSRKLKVEDYE